MTKRFGLFAKDGLRISGDLPEDQYSPLAKEITNGYMSLFFRSTAQNSILASCFTLKPMTGGREEGFIFFCELTNDEIKTTSVLTLIQEYFRTAIDYINKADYEVISLYGEQRIKDKQFTIPHTRQIKEFSDIISGKIIFAKPSFVYSKDFVQSLSFFCNVLNDLKPVIHLGYSFIISKLIVNADLIICSNRHPDETKIDLDLDTNKLSIPPEFNEKYQTLPECLFNQNLIDMTKRKEDIIPNFLNLLKNLKQKEIENDWTLFTYQNYPGGDKIVHLSVKNAITDLIEGKTNYFISYINSKQYQKGDLESALDNIFLSEDLRKIEKNAQFINRYPSPETREEILTLIKNAIKLRTPVIPKSFEPRIKEPVKKPVYDMSGSSIPDNYLKIAIIAGILILLAVIGFVVVNPLHIAAFNFFGVLPAPGSDDAGIPATDLCSRDFNTPDCELPLCCVVPTKDNQGFIMVPKNGILNNTKIHLTTESASEYKKPMQIQNTAYHLQNDAVYYVNLENFKPTGGTSPILKITVKNFDNFRKGFIAKYDTQNNTWRNITIVDPTPRDYYQTALESPDGYYGLFIEDQKIN